MHYRAAASGGIARIGSGAPWMSDASGDKTVNTLGESLWTQKGEYAVLREAQEREVRPSLAKVPNV